MHILKKIVNIEDKGTKHSTEKGFLKAPSKLKERLIQIKVSKVEERRSLFAVTIIIYYKYPRESVETLTNPTNKNKTMCCFYSLFG